MLSHNPNSRNNKRPRIIKQKGASKKSKTARTPTQSADITYNKGIDIINNLAELDDLIALKPEALEKKYHEAIVLINAAADLYSKRREPKNVVSTYQELAKICEKFIADNLMQLAEYKHGAGETQQAVFYFELAFSFYREAIDLDKFAKATLDLHEKALGALRSLAKIEPDCADEYQEKISSYMQKYNIKEKPKHELRTFSQEVLKYIKQQAKEREDTKKQAIEVAKKITVKTPEFIRSFEDAVIQFSAEISTELTEEIIGQLFYHIGSIYSASYNKLQVRKFAHGFYNLSATFNNLKAVMLHLAVNNDPLPQPQNLSKHSLFRPDYHYDITTTQNAERRLAARDHSAYFMNVLCDHIANVYLALNTDTKEVLANLFYQLGKKITKSSSFGLQSKHGRLLILEAAKWQHTSAIDWVRNPEMQLSSTSQYKRSISA